MADARTFICNRFAATLTSLFLMLCFTSGAWAAVGGSVSGTVKDQTGGVVPGANLSIRNTALGTEYKTSSDGQGLYAFPSLAVGRYDFTINAPSFRSQKKTALFTEQHQNKNQKNEAKDELRS